MHPPLALQVFAQLSIKRSRQPVVKDWISMEERSIYSSNQVFSQANSASLDASDRFILNRLQEHLTESDRIDGIFYFDVPVSVAWE